MQRHATLYELVAKAAGDAESLTDWPWLREHLERCPACARRFKGLSDPAEAAVHPRAPQCPDSPQRGVVFMPVFTEGVHRVPAAVKPMVILTDPAEDPVTGLTILRAANLHDSPAMAARGDLFLEDTDAGLGGWVAALWSAREMVAAAAAPERFLGCLDLDTIDLMAAWRNTENTPDSPRFAHGSPGANAGPRMQHRRRILLDYDTFSADLSARRQWKVRVLDAVYPLLPDELRERYADGTGALGDIVFHYIDPSNTLPFVLDTRFTAHEQQVAYAAAAGGPDPFVADAAGLLLRAEAYRGEPRTHRMLKALIESERYIRTGKPSLRHEARKLLAGIDAGGG